MEEKIEELRELLSETYDDTGSYITSILVLVRDEEMAGNLITIVENLQPPRDKLLMYAMAEFEKRGGNLGE